MGKTRVRVRVGSSRFVFFAFYFSFRSSEWKKLGLGLGFDPSSFFFPFSPLSDLHLGFLESDPPFSPSSIPCSVLILGIRVRS